MDDNKTLFTRAEFHAYIWATPLAVQTRDYGLTELRMEAICLDYDIPCPPVGYWKRRAEGEKKPRKRRLPKSTRDFPLIAVTKTSKFGGPSKRPPDPILIQHRETVAAAGPILVPSVLPADPHPVVSGLIVALADAEADRRGALKVNVPPVSTELTDQSIERALILVNTLLVALEQRGHRVRDGAVLVYGEPFTFHIRDSKDIAIHVVTAKEKAAERTRLWENKYLRKGEHPRAPASTPKWDYDLSGRLVLEVRIAFRIPKSPHNVRFWYNQGQFRIEDKLDQVIAAMYAAAGHAREERRQRAESLKQQKLQSLSEVTKRDWQIYIRELIDVHEQWLRLQAFDRYIDALSASNPYPLTSLRSGLSEMIRDAQAKCSFESLADHTLQFDQTYERRRGAIFAEDDEGAETPADANDDSSLDPLKHLF